ncbi:M28 family peptidase [Parasphingorhabdus sp.]|uniref:M28 family peptidase n=1 Tax=Parasphingorhabdus sp. TaxID=2709688 RepID=UPI00326560D3
MRFVLVPIVILFWSISPAQAEDITEKDLLEHIDILASDAFGGRKPGTTGENKTVNYIATSWAKAGLTPGVDNKNWYMPVTLVERTPLTQDIRFSRAAGNKRKNISIGDDQIVLRGAEKDIRFEQVELVHAGYGLGDPESLRARVSGKMAFLYLSGRPAVPDFPSYQKRKKNLLAAGARGVIAIVKGEARWSRFARRYKRTGTNLDQAGLHAEIEGLISAKAIRKIMRKAGLDADMIAAGSAEKDYLPAIMNAAVTLSVNTRVHKFKSHNVIGKIAGKEPKSGVLLFLGHWDHFGTCLPKTAEDRICNGAVDNASGISLLIETAERLALAKLDRDIYFLATTAEESGLLGARAFASDPAFPLDRLVVAFNADSVALTPDGKKIAVIGLGQTALDPQIEKVAEMQGREIDMSGKPDVFLARQDGYVFTDKGYPAFMITSAFADEERLNAFLAGRYHDVSDESDSGLELGGARDDANFHVALGQYFGSLATYPKKPTSGATQN